MRENHSFQIVCLVEKFDFRITFENPCFTLEKIWTNDIRRSMFYIEKHGRPSFKNLDVHILPILLKHGRPCFLDYRPIVQHPWNTTTQTTRVIWESAQKHKHCGSRFVDPSCVIERANNVYVTYFMVQGLRNRCC